MQKIILGFIFLSFWYRVNSQNVDIEHKISNFMCTNEKILIKKVTPIYLIPFLRVDSTSCNYMVEKMVFLNNRRKDSLYCNFYFSMYGNFQYLETFHKVHDTIKLHPSTRERFVKYGKYSPDSINLKMMLEYNLKSTGGEIISLLDEESKIDVEILVKMLKNFDISTKSEINLSYVNYIDFTNKYSSPIPKFILYGWEVKNWRPPSFKIEEYYYGDKVRAVYNRYGELESIVK